jgi:hypothetical protein
MKRKRGFGVPNRRRVKRRIYRRRPMPRRIVPAKLAIKRTFYLQNWTFGTAATDGFWRNYAFSLNQMPNVVEFTGLFDEYKINAIKVTFRPSYDSITSDSQGVVANSAPQAYAHIFVDPAATNPAGVYGSATLNSFLENDKVRSYTTNRPFSVYWKPLVRDALQGTGPNAEIRRSRYIRTVETGAVYTGFQMFLQQNNFATTNARINLDVFVTFYATFKNLR